MSALEDPLHRLHRDLGLKTLLGRWAKVEILLGLVAVVGGLFGGMRLAAFDARSGNDADIAAWLGMAALVVLGGYLTLAGHRSHLYQSNNRLVAYLAELIRAPQAPPRDHP